MFIASINQDSFQQEESYFLRTVKLKGNWFFFRVLNLLTQCTMSN